MRPDGGLLRRQGRGGYLPWAPAGPGRAHASSHLMLETGRNWEEQGRSLTKLGDSYFSEIHNFTMGIPTSCFILFTSFRTVFVFALGRFVPKVVNLFDLVGQNGRLWPSGHRTMCHKHRQVRYP